MKKTKNVLLSISMITLCFNAMAQTEKEPLRAEFINNIVMDGDDSDWESAISFYDESSGLMYSVANDDENLYVLVKATAQAAMVKFTMGGVELWVSADGKEKRKTGIKYPIPLSWEERMSSRDRNATREERRNNENERTYKTMEVRGFDNIKDKIYAVDELDVKAEYSGKNGNSIVEYKIPLALFCKPEQINGDNVFAIGVVLNGMQMPNFGAAVGGRPLRMGNGQQQRDMRDMAKSYSFWIYAQITK
jgi:hypothetical protein